MITLNPIDAVRFTSLLNSIRNFGDRRIETIVEQETDQLVIDAKRDVPKDTRELELSIMKNQDNNVIVDADHGLINEFGGRNHPRQPFFLQNARNTSTRISDRIRNELRRL